MTPLSNSFLKEDQLNQMEPFFPLNTFLCESCNLVQIPEFINPEHIFEDYIYFSSFSDSWVEHTRIYAESLIKRFGIGPQNLVIELASNDGHFLKHFQNHNIPVLGIEPAKNIIKTAETSGIPSLNKFFNSETAKELFAQQKTADLLLGNNILAHVPNLNDFVSGMKILLKPDGVISMEFPHLLKLIELNQFDTIYHEHFSYFSFTTAEKVFKKHGLVIFDVEEIPTHGGSLRIFSRHKEDSSKAITERVNKMRLAESAARLGDWETYQNFSQKVKDTKNTLLKFLITAKQSHKTIVGYGAPAKANTLLNYCSIGKSFIDYTVDRSPHKQGKFLPGTHIPIFSPEKIKETQPNYLLILPWNIQEEIIRQTAFIKEWGGQFLIPIPQLKILM